jgi:tryptophan synthase alpha chain
VTGLPLAVGFGISTAAQVRTVGAVADAVVVGTAFVRVVEQNAAGPDLPAKLEALARDLAGGLPSRNP